MPRRARLDAPGILRHIIIRGIENRPIFIDDVDGKNFLNRLSQLVEDNRMKIYAWTLLPNHAHFLLRSGFRGLSNFMHRLLLMRALNK